MFRAIVEFVCNTIRPLYPEITDADLMEDGAVFYMNDEGAERLWRETGFVGDFCVRYLSGHDFIGIRIHPGGMTEILIRKDGGGLLRAQLLGVRIPGVHGREAELVQKLNRVENATGLRNCTLESYDEPDLPKPLDRMYTPCRVIAPGSVSPMDVIIKRTPDFDERDDLIWFYGYSETSLRRVEIAGYTICDGCRVLFVGRSSDDIEELI